MQTNIIRRTVDLSSARQVEALRGVLATTEESAHTFIVTATRDGAQVALAGTVAGVFVRPDGTTVPLTGRVESGAAVVTLSAACYAQPGRFELAIFATADGATVALYLACGTVRRSQTEVVVDPGDIIPSVQQLIDDIAAAVESIPEDYTALEDEVDDLKSQIDVQKNINTALGTALINCFSNVAWTGTNGQSYIDAISNIFFPGVASISAVYTQSGEILSSDSLDSLKTDLVVTVTMTDTSTEVLSDSDYTLSGSLTGGASTITVSYAGKTTTFVCIVNYALSEAVVMSGTESIDTGWEITDMDNITICFDATFTGFTSSGDAGFVFSNFVSGDAYVGASANTRKAYWGAGISYANRRTLADNDRIRAVVTINATQGTVKQDFKNVTSGVSGTYSRTPPSDRFENTNHFLIGKPNNNVNPGFYGTIHDFQILGRALTSTEISNYLAGE